MAGRLAWDLASTSHAPPGSMASSARSWQHVFHESDVQEPRKLDRMVAFAEEGRPECTEDSERVAESVAGPGPALAARLAQLQSEAARLQQENEHLRNKALARRLEAEGEKERAAAGASKGVVAQLQQEAAQVLALFQGVLQPHAGAEHAQGEDSIGAARKLVGLARARLAVLSGSPQDRAAPSAEQLPPLQARVGAQLDAVARVACASLSKLSDQSLSREAPPAPEAQAHPPALSLPRGCSPHRLAAAPGQQLPVPSAALGDVGEDVSPSPRLEDQLRLLEQERSRLRELQHLWRMAVMGRHT